ncbi:MAG: type IVB secretion system apparatus protein IcmL/DotI [Proteobacteria bacterium]|nr:type IVB secretion system apparatus protein IcmL/DotI [Pseudomonadota bacterium]
MANEQAAELVQLRNEFYRDNYRRVMLTLLLSLVINFFLGALVFYVYMNPPKPKYFATSINGRVTPLYPLDRPNQSDSAVLQWANQAAIASYTYNFVNYRQELQAASEFFTTTGWKNFLDELDASNTLDAVKAKRLIVSAVATQAPVILEKGVIEGRYSWRVQMPILVTFQSSSEFSQARYMVNILIVRVSTLNSPRGIGIAQFIAAPGQ